MNPPNIPDYTLSKLIGEGSTGSVWSARYQGQRELAIKCLRSLAINRQLLSDALVKIYNAPAHPGIAPIRDFDLASPQAYVTTDLYAEAVKLADGRRVLRPRTLEPSCGAMPPAEGWGIAVQIADALAFLHRMGIAHCNIKPSNILFATDDEDGPPRPMLTDFAQGMLGGIEQIEPGDSLFYASPEQLRGADHPVQGHSEKWDVYSFGVTVYRLLTGKYPRLDAAITEIGRSNAKQLDLRVKIAPAQIADALAPEGEISWPTEAEDDTESERRKIVETCLRLDPDTRYVDMREVLAAFRDTENTSRHTKAIADLEQQNFALSQAGTSAKRRARISAIGALAAVGVAAFALYGKLVGGPASHSKENDKVAAVAAPEQDPALLAERDAKLLAESSLTGALDDLRHTWSALDSIFEMIAARDGDGNPLYDIPEGTLGTILNYYDEFALRHDGKPEMGESLAGALHNSGQLHMMLGNHEDARANLTNATILLENLEAGDGGGEGSLLSRRAAIYQDLSDAESAARLPRAAIASSQQAHQIFATLSERDPASASASRALASSSLQVARKIADDGRPEEASRYIGEADSLLEKLETQNQTNEDDLVLLAASSFERGRAERALGQREAAIQAQIDSIDRYLGLLEARPNVPAYRFQLARAYGEAADLAAMLGEPDEALTANKEASELLRSLADSNADKPAYRHELARRMRATAARLRDSGKGTAALAEQDKALVLLDDLHRSFPANSDYAYDLAIVSSIQADLSAEAKKHKEAITLSRRSVVLMQELLDEDTDLENNRSKRPKYRKALAALYGKLGHHTEHLGDKEKARHCFNKSLKQYQNVAASDPEDRGATQGIDWAEQRLARLPSAP